METYGKELKESFITRMPAQNISEAELTRKQKSASTHYIDGETMQRSRVDSPPTLLRQQTYGVSHETNSKSCCKPQY